jgi:hypothetical protein
MDITPTLRFVDDCFHALYDAMTVVFGVLSISLNDIANTSLDGAFYNYPLSAILLGAGFAAYCIVTIAKFIIGIVK